MSLSFTLRYYPKIWYEICIHGVGPYRRVCYNFKGAGKISSRWQGLIPVYLDEGLKKK